ncbi:glycoside hydrolase N-terminal domain-containing protein [Streptomyces sp. ISL-22]|uniref:glycosyl hydrolase family 95 catalytic domain-containing protein n=1 Tax=unclassified Streptomyces TaxID=2593676 RepID=UPI001BE5E243|nr:MULTISPECIES: glycoside hydrolase N-terminal domain-containing protein [unclassified Streptomyces]MBT2421024.1 glycoside hydrolase N-terminal domain-containing protein [Streptomyces sp. ISL-24]MBT2430906.1 glycoside hydrolase N-terminal domain-containing protein [Streptomyces sp. ISL-22]
MTGPVHGTWEPAPAVRWEDAFLSGNGRHGVMVFGDPNDDRVIVNHHTLVRPNGGEHARPPALAAELTSLQDRLLAGDVTAAERFTDGRDVQWVQPFHPAFRMGLRRPAAGTSGYRRAVDFTTGVTHAECAGWRSRVFVSRADDVIVQQVEADDLVVTLDHRLPGAPAALVVGQSIVRACEGALLTLRVRYPDSDRGYTGITLVVPTGGRTALIPPGARVTGADSVLLLTRVVRHTGELDTAAHADALRDLLTESGTYSHLLDRHTPLHRTAYERVTLDLAADPAERALPGSELLSRPKSPALLERLFAAGRYHLLSASGMLPPRLTGLWTGDWNTAWSGAFTTDANLNLQTASAAAAALPEVTEAHAALIHGQVDHWRYNARAIFGTRGVVAPAHTDGESGHLYHFSREYPLHLWTAGADWLLKPLVDHDETRGEQDPRTAAVLAEVARFYEDFLTRTDDEGNLVVVPSYSPENRPANASWGTVNAAMDLSAARHALRTAARYHPEHADRWRALADRLPPHRINADGALAEWARPGLEDTYDHRHLSHLYGVWPLDEITPYDTPDLATAAHRALELRGAENDSAHGHLHHALIAARLRDGERVAHALDQVLDGDFFHASLMSAHYPKRDVYNADAAHTLPAVLIETLVQSTPDRLVLLPALPAALPQGRLRGVRTRFGAEVDLTWSPNRATAVIRPTRTHRVELRTSSGAEPLDLVAGEDHVLHLGEW